MGNNPLNATDPTGMCSYDEDGNAVSGLCATDEATQAMVDQWIADPDHTFNQVEALANEAGDIIDVEYLPGISAADASALPPDPDSNYAPNGLVVLGGAPDALPGSNADGSGGPTIPALVDEVANHEGSHLLDYYQGGYDQVGTGVIEHSGVEVSVIRGGVERGAQEARAVNRTNAYREATGRIHRRTEY